MLQPLTSARSRKPGRAFGIFLLLWTLLNCIQAAITGLLHDETYYWMYSENPAWGYFDHPPMIALMIRAGYFLFPNAFGVRFFSILAGSATLWILWKLCPPEYRNITLFIILTGSLTFVQAGGILAVPDVPLLFFTALFFLLYKEYIRRYDLLHGIFLALVIAAMLYSKYHAVLVIIFTLAANPKLFAKRSFWMIAILSCALFMPHVYWQYSHGFPSLHYHLSDRFTTPYTPMQTLSYLGGQLAFAGIASGAILFYAAWRARDGDVFTRTLRWNLFGVFILFFLATFYGRSEANWTSVAYIPLIMLGYSTLAKMPRLRRVFYFSAVPVCVLLLGLRFYIPFGTLPRDISLLNEVQGWSSWAETMRETASGRPVVFMNSYQKASKYSWFTKQTSYSLDNNRYRRTQYEIWNSDSSFQGRDVMLVLNFPSRHAEQVFTSAGLEYYRFIPDYHSFDQVQVSPDQHAYTGHSGDTIPVIMHAHNAGWDARFYPGPGEETKWNVLISRDDKVIYDHAIDSMEVRSLARGADFSQTVHVPLPTMQGSYKMFITIRPPHLYGGLQGPAVKLEVQ